MAPPILFSHLAWKVQYKLLPPISKSYLPPCNLKSGVQNMLGMVSIAEFHGIPGFETQIEPKRLPSPTKLEIIQPKGTKYR